MKKRNKFFVALAFLGMSAGVTSAQTSGSCGANLTWELTGTGNNLTLTISGTGAINSYSAENTPWYSSRNNITAIVIENGVTGIGKPMRYDVIGGSHWYGIFFNCSNLSSLTLPLSSCADATVLGSLFYSITYTSGIYSTTPPIPLTGEYTCQWHQDATYSGIQGFGYYVPRSLVTVNITDNGVIKSNFFRGTNIPQVSMPLVTGIAQNAFYGCNITTANIPSVTSIGNDAFYGCGNLTSVTMPNVISIGSNAFYGCNITTANIPNVTSIGNKAFYRCSSLTTIDAAANNPNYSSDNGVLFNKNKTTIIQYPTGKTDVSYIIPNTVTTIGNFAFSGCIGLTEVTIPKSVTNIENGTFSDCSGLTTVNFNAANTRIFNRVEYPEYPPEDYVSVFSGCMNFTILNIGNDVTIIPYLAFYGCQIKEVIIPNSVTEIEPMAFYWCGGLTSVTIPKSVTTIGALAFTNCISLTSVINKSATPQAIFYYDSYYGYYDVFGIDDECAGYGFDYNHIYKKATLYVPSSAFEEYIGSYGWSKFYNIQRIEDENSINEVLANSARIVGFYGILGEKLPREPQNGVYIVKYDNGKTEKKLGK